MAKGGKRPGSGRKPGITNRPQLRNFYTPKELDEFIVSLKERAKTDSNLAKFVAEQIFGKAPQPIVGDANDRTPIPLLHVRDNNGDGQNSRAR